MILSSLTSSITCNSWGSTDAMLFQLTKRERYALGFIALLLALGLLGMALF